MKKIFAFLSMSIISTNGIAGIIGIKENNNHSHNNNLTALVETNQEVTKINNEIRVYPLVNDNDLNIEEKTIILIIKPKLWTEIRKFWENAKRCSFKKEEAEKILFANAVVTKWWHTLLIQQVNKTVSFLSMVAKQIWDDWDTIDYSWNEYLQGKSTMIIAYTWKQWQDEKKSNYMHNELKFSVMYSDPKL